MIVYKVSELTEDMIGNSVTVDAVVKYSKVGVAANGSPYMDIELGDAKGSIMGKIWGVSDATKELVESNKFIRVSGNVSEYNKKLQVVIKRVGTIPADELVEAELLKIAPVPVTELIEYVEESIGMIEDEAIRLIVENRYKLLKDKFIKWPAAKGHHHNYETGLLYHTASMLRLARYNLANYPENELDKDILIGATILHDIEKTREYSGVDNIQFTEDGKLMGHIFLSGAEVFHLWKLLEKNKPEIDTTKVPLMIHAILAHHGKLEWGSPVAPGTKDAEILHQIDMMDSRMNSKY